MAEVAISEEVLEALRDRILRLQEIVQDPHTPLDQAELAQREAKALREREVKLEAARFNEASQNYREALAELEDAQEALKEALGHVGHIADALGKAGRVIAALDRLIGTAARIA